MSDTISTIEAAAGAAQFVASQVAKYYGGVVGQAAATYLLGEASWVASTTDLAVKAQSGAATGEDVAEVFSKTASALAGFGVLAGLASPAFLTIAGAASGVLFVYEKFVSEETKQVVWDSTFKAILEHPFAQGLNLSYDDVVNPSVNTTFLASRSFAPKGDPLVLDLDGDGLETLGINTTNPILFDHNGDGVKTATGWVKPDDGFLVFDRNGNGTIDSGRELFGDSTLLYAGAGQTFAADGFAALAQEDSNHDGLVNASDANFASLRIWRDLNQDGISQAGELFTLASQNIAALKVARSANSQLLANGKQPLSAAPFCCFSEE